MSSFLSKPDYLAHIDSDILERLLDGDDAKLDAAEVQAITYMKGFSQPGMTWMPFSELPAPSATPSS